MRLNLDLEKSSDPLDVASSLTEMAITTALHANRLQFKSADYRGTGECLFCGEATPEFNHNGNLVPARWCDADCRDMYLREEAKSYE